MFRKSNVNKTVSLTHREFITVKTVTLYKKLSNSISFIKSLKHKRKNIMSFEKYGWAIQKRSTKILHFLTPARVKKYLA